MTTNQYIEKLNKLGSIIKSEEFNNRMLIIPANVLLADMIDRISGGKDSNNNRIGDYSKTKSYAGRKAFDNKSNFKPKLGEFSTAIPPRKDLFKPVAKRTSVLLKDGYFELRQRDGYSNSVVNLIRTGDGIKNITIDKAKRGEVIIGFTDENQAVKFRGYENKNNKNVLKPTRNEQENFIDTQKKEIELVLKEAFI
jgi:hypothetical protein